MFKHIIDLLFKFLRQIEIVGIKECDILPLRFLQGVVARTGSPLIFLIKVSNPVIIELAYNFAGMIRRAVINNNNFKFLIGLI
jgi:hypothetical protein